MRTLLTTAMAIFLSVTSSFAEVSTSTANDVAVKQPTLSQEPLLDSLLTLQGVGLCFALLILGIFIGALVTQSISQRMLKAERDAFSLQRQYLDESHEATKAEQATLLEKVNGLTDILERRTDPTKFEKDSLALEDSAWQVVNLAQNLAARLSQSYAESSRIEDADATLFSNDFSQT